MKTHQVYIGMGGNIGDAVPILNESLKEIKALDAVSDLRCSHYYRTSPVGLIEQDDFVNAVCTFKTTLSPKDLYTHLRVIEKKLGKIPKPKDHPRVIDLDLLFHGMEMVKDKDLEVPHPKWDQRLFVLIPMKDLVNELTYVDLDGGVQTIQLDQLINNFDNINNEKLEIIK